MEKQKIYLLYNPLAKCGNWKAESEKAEKFFKDREIIKKDITTLSSCSAYEDFFEEAKEDDILIAGGDGTLNRFVNDIGDIEFKNGIFYYPCGTGNDFWNDLGKTENDGPLDISEYLKDLPTVTVNGITKKFINGIGYGIDGYCCEVGDKLRAEGKQNINYAGIAIKGLLFHFKTKNATVIADGKEFKFNKVWLAPTMLGRYYGGGMIPTPDQKKIKYKQTSFVYGFIRFGQIKNAYGFS